jgi:hypothetical protein
MSWSREDVIIDALSHALSMAVAMGMGNPVAVDPSAQGETT